MEEILEGLITLVEKGCPVSRKFYGIAARMLKPYEESHFLVEKLFSHPWGWLAGSISGFFFTIF